MILQKRFWALQKIDYNINEKDLLGGITYLKMRKLKKNCLYLLLGCKN